MADPFLGMIALVPYNFPPRGWTFCNGQILAISQNTALFSLLGTTYGGNGVTTFALPDLRGRVPLSSGQGPGLSNYDLGELSGTENVTLTTNQMPIHTHALGVSAKEGTSESPVGAVPAAGGAYGPADTPQNPALAGGSQPFSIVQPFLTLNYIIALEGIFPSRN